MIKFGTDGWRAIVGKDFTQENVKRVSYAIAKYVQDSFGFEKLIIIGYDPRNMAKEFAEQCGSYLFELGFDIKISQRVVPTPVLAYNARLLNACAIMFTASHNPPEYLGMKFIPDYAGPATAEITDQIVANIDKGCGSDLRMHSKEYVDFGANYYAHLEKLIDYNKIKKLNTNIIFDGLYSASIGYFDKIMDEKGIQYTSLHMQLDTNFGGGMPDPKPKYLSELINSVKANPNSIGLANDGDADRFGVINEDGEFVSPNEIIAILLKYLQNKGLTGAVVKTVGSSLLIDLVAQKLGVPVIETAVGFKHVGQAMRDNSVIIGGEESGGLSIQSHIPEKDGLIANLLILEAMADSGKKLTELQKEIYDIAGCKFYTDRIDLRQSNSEVIASTLNKFKLASEIGKFKITNKDLKDGVKLMLGNSTKILVRPSGTEPLLRIYFETETEEKLSSLKQEVEKFLA